MEFFEITFIINNYNHDAKSDSSIKKIIESSRICNSDFISIDYSSIWFDKVEDVEINKLYVSLPNIKFSENNLKELLGIILEMVSDCFEYVPEIEFATGIFEMSYYYFEDINKTNRLEDFTYDILSHFPIIFCRVMPNIKDDAFLKHKNTICIFRQGDGIQDIF